MTTSKRRRGRPIGSCKDDTQFLIGVANVLMAHPGMRPTTAIKRVLGSPNPSPIRRLQSKWKQDGPRYMRGAQARRSTIAMQASYQGLADARARLNSQMREIGDFLGTTNMRSSMTLEPETATEKATKALQDAIRNTMKGHFRGSMMPKWPQETLLSLSEHTSPVGKAMAELARARGPFAEAMDNLGSDQLEALRKSLAVPLRGTFQ